MKIMNDYDIQYNLDIIIYAVGSRYIIMTQTFDKKILLTRQKLKLDNL